MFFFVVLYYICKCRKPKAIEEGMFAEFWADLKIGIYPIYFILKRIVMVVTAAALWDISWHFQLIPLLVVSVFPLVFTPLRRPFKHVRENLIEFLGSCLFTMLVALMMAFRKASDWPRWRSLTVIFVICGVNCVISIICFTFMVVSLVKCVKDKVKKLKSRRKKQYEIEHLQSKVPLTQQ